jgi:hypothetical protein
MYTYVTTTFLKIKNYKFKTVENFEYLGVILNGDHTHQTDLQERIKILTNNTLCYKNFFKNENIPKKLESRLTNTIIDKTLIYVSETLILTKR